MSENNIQVFVQQILQIVPEWSEGVIVVKNKYNLPVVLPIAKTKSKKFKNEYYSSFKWRPLNKFPYILLFKLIGKVILKDGQIQSVYIVDNGDRYFSIKIVQQ